jgi:hypothetical protein
MEREVGQVYISVKQRLIQFPLIPEGILKGGTIGGEMRNLTFH